MRRVVGPRGAELAGEAATANGSGSGLVWCEGRRGRGEWSVERCWRAVLRAAMSIWCQKNPENFRHEIDIMSIWCQKHTESSRHEIDMNAMRDGYIGRGGEQEEFRRLLQKKTASLVTCQGRRRIGKSRFLAECAR